MKWPHNKDFAFTIIDDTDNATVTNVKPIYNFLKSKSILTSKTTWVFPPNDSFQGQSLSEKDYYNFLLEIENQGFEILLHGVGSGTFKRSEIIKGFEIFNEKFGRYPSVYINHSFNPDNIYWGYKRFGPFLGFLTKQLAGKSREFFGDIKDSDFYWGDLSKKYIKFNRNRVFYSINTLKNDPKMPFMEKNKRDCNYWFSSSDGQTIMEFNNLTSPKNIDKLVKENGLSIVYTHFACGFVDSNCELDSTFKYNIEYLSSKNGWFVPVSQILDYLLRINKNHSVDSNYLNSLDLRWLRDRIRKKIKYGR
jgi:hypothetical protein